MVVLAEYIWIDGYGELRSKIKVFDTSVLTLTSLPLWNFDGSSTNQADTKNSEVVLRPVQVYKGPFTSHYLVMCDLYVYEDDKLVPHRDNTRSYDFEKAARHKPWYGIEQEYYLTKLDGSPLIVLPQGKYYCGTNPRYMVGREVAEEHMIACLQAGLKVSGINAEVGPGQWEYQIGPVEGIEAADQLWISRYILLRIAEKHQLGVSFHPKALGAGHPGSGCHINFSTQKMRKDGGYNTIVRTVEHLRNSHAEYIQYCGEGSDTRLTGEHETANIKEFSWGVGTRNTSVRIPTETCNNQCGYFEDRRPSSNMDPYKLCTAIFKAAIEAELFVDLETRS